MASSHFSGLDFPPAKIAFEILVPICFGTFIEFNSCIFVGTKIFGGKISYRNYLKNKNKNFSNFFFDF